MKILSKEFYRQKMKAFVENEEKWKLFQNASVFVLFGLISLIMSVVNLFSKQGLFTWMTMGFALACLIDLLLLMKKGTYAKVAIILFAIEITVTFLFFIVSGIPDGFNVLWTAMLPSFGLLMFGVRNGSLLSAVMFAALVFFFWTPFGRGLLQYPYENTFMTRFPLLYLAFFVVAMLLEQMREMAYSALRESRLKYEFLCYHDALTGLYNRFWLQSLVGDPVKELKPAAVAVLDIDNFKFINDNFGHLNGDIVIRGFGQAILDTLGSSGELCRWGGDEFLILFHTDIDAETVCKRIVDVIRAQEFEFNGERLNTTVTVGLVIAPNGGTTDVRALLHQADVNLYLAKDQGKNCTVCSQLKSEPAPSTN